MSPTLCQTDTALARERVVRGGKVPHLLELMSRGEERETDDKQNNPSRTHHLLESGKSYRYHSEEGPGLMVGVAVLDPGVSEGHKEGGLKEEQSRGGRKGGMEIAGEKCFGPREQPVQRPRGGVVPGALAEGGHHWREEELARETVGELRSERLGGSGHLLTWADQPSQLTLTFTAPSPTLFRTTQWGRRVSGKPPAPPDLEQGGSNGEGGKVRLWTHVDDSNAWVNCLGTAGNKRNEGSPLFVSLPSGGTERPRGKLRLLWNSRKREPRSLFRNVAPFRASLAYTTSRRQWPFEPGVRGQM